MTDQPQLFHDPTVRERSEIPIPLRERRPGWKATPAPIGSGPPGETCRTCRYAHRLRAGSKAFYKCDLMRYKWTGGTATDIKLKWAACRSWEAAELEQRIRDLGEYAKEVLDGAGFSKASLLIIADYYEELGSGQDMAWLRHCAAKFSER